MREKGSTVTRRRARLYSPTAFDLSGSPFTPDTPPEPPGGPGSPPPEPPAPSGGEPVNLTQTELDARMARTRDEAKRAARTEILTELGVEDTAKAKEQLEAARARELEHLSEAERATAAAENRERAAAVREASAAEAQLAARVRIALTAHSVNPDDLDDAEALLRRDIQADSDDEAIQAAAKALAERRTELFGGKTEPRRTRSTGPGSPPPPTRTPPKQEDRGAAGRKAAEKRYGDRAVV